jgi:hypothetical protein
MTNQVNLVIPVIKFLHQPMILLILIGSSVKKSTRTRSGQSVSDTVSQLILDHDAHHHSRLNQNYITDSASHDSNYQGRYQKSNNEI